MALAPSWNLRGQDEEADESRQCIPVSTEVDSLYSFCEILQTQEPLVQFAIETHKSSTELEKDDHTETLLSHLVKQTTGYHTRTAFGDIDRLTVSYHRSQDS